MTNPKATSITDRLNSGAIHAAMHARHPDRVDAKGNLHCTPERAEFVNWLDKMRCLYGASVADWPQTARDEYARRYVPSH